VHEVAQSVAKDSRVVYVDNDPLVRVHADVLLATDPNTIFLTGDLREPEELLGRPELRDHLDLSKPVALLLVAVLQFIEDNQQAYDIVKTLCDALPAGSYLVLSHPLKDESVEQALAVYRRANIGGRSRTEEEIRRFFDGLTPVGCGLARAAEWTPRTASPRATTSSPSATPRRSSRCPGCSASPGSTAEDRASSPHPARSPPPLRIAPATPGRPRTREEMLGRCTGPTPAGCGLAPSGNGHRPTGPARSRTPVTSWPRAAPRRSARSRGCAGSPVSTAGATSSPRGRASVHSALRRSGARRPPGGGYLLIDKR